MSLFDTGDSICEADLNVGYYEGQLVEIWGWPDLDWTTPRLAVGIGRRFSVFRVPAELTAGIGTVRTKTWYIARTEVINWRPWFGGTLAGRFTSGVGVQLEVGRHQLAERYYVPGQDVVVAEIRRWEDMLMFAVSVPLL